MIFPDVFLPCHVRQLIETQLQGLRKRQLLLLCLQFLSGLQVISRGVLWPCHTRQLTETQLQGLHKR